MNTQTLVRLAFQGFIAVGLIVALNLGTMLVNRITGS